ncbi:MAG: SxtJ family membrane protein [Woeseia sp.]
MNDAQVIPELDRKGLRDFGLTSGAIVAVLFGLFFPWLMERDFPLWPWILFGTLVAWSLGAASTLRPVYRVWMRFGLLMSRILIPVLMALVFFLVVTPLGAVRRAMFGDQFPKHKDASLDSYRSPSESRKADDMKRPF